MQAGLGLQRLQRRQSPDQLWIVGDFRVGANRRFLMPDLPPDRIVHLICQRTGDFADIGAGKNGYPVTQNRILDDAHRVIQRRDHLFDQTPAHRVTQVCRGGGLPASEDREAVFRTDHPDRIRHDRRRAPGPVFRDIVQQELQLVPECFGDEQPFDCAAAAAEHLGKIDPGHGTVPETVRFRQPGKGVPRGQGQQAANGINVAEAADRRASRKHEQTGGSDSSQKHPAIEPVADDAVTRFHHVPSLHVSRFDCV